MLATLVIGLREGLEASLIVGIIAAFLVRNGKSLRPMWIGVGSAVGLSILVGVILEVVSAELPQAQQEGMESIIGLVAVAFVTGMIGWMNTHARNLRSELEAEATVALRGGAAWGLVAMAFLAVLKEGFETSVFLLAAFQSSSSALVAGLGAVIGVGIAVIIGFGIYRGGVRLNLGRFFRVTGFFLVVVAAGLVLTAIRTAHEAGWIVVGQQQIVDLSWLAPRGSIQAALITGVLGIPTDPRLIEVLGWIAYLVPALLYLLWPLARRPKPARLPRFHAILAGSLAALGLVLAFAVPLPGTVEARTAPLVDATGASAGTASLTRDGDGFALATIVSGARSTTALASSDAKTEDYAGLSAKHWTASETGPVAGKPATLSVDELVTVNGGRLPIGISATQDPGPFDAAWKTSTTSSVWVAGQSLLDGSYHSTTTLTLSGGGLVSPRVVTVASATPTWSVASEHASSTVSDILAARSGTREALLFKLWIPIALGIAALVLLASALRGRIVRRKRALAEMLAFANAVPVPARTSS